MINEPTPNYLKKRVDKSLLSSKEHLPIDVSEMAQKCIREGIIPNDLQITEANTPPAVLVRKVELELIALLRASLPTPRQTTNGKRMSGESFISGPESRRPSRSVADDVKGLIQRCVKENIAPSDLQLTESGRPRDFLIRRINQRILDLLKKHAKEA